MFDENEVIIFPRPKKCEYTSENKCAVLGMKGLIKCIISIAENPDLLEMEAAKLISEKIMKEIGSAPEIIKGSLIKKDLLIIRISTFNYSQESELLPFQKEEAYCLDINQGDITIYANEGKGAFYGAQTLNQLIKIERNLLVLPVCKINDWPDKRHRGLFVENRYGTDRMTLHDWRKLIDYMASMKMNFLGVGVYGCWCIQYQNEISEYLYLPINKYPDLKTRRKVVYYSILNNKWETIDYLPEMYEADFFGELIKYGKSKNIIVSPQFNSMGHNTLIPRLYPEVSARDEQGKLTGFGFCTLIDKTYNVLFEIFDEIIDRYLMPNGINWFNIGYKRKQGSQVFWHEVICAD